MDARAQKKPDFLRTRTKTRTPADKQNTHKDKLLGSFKPSSQQMDEVYTTVPGASSGRDIRGR